MLSEPPPPWCDKRNNIISDVRFQACRDQPGMESSFSADRVIQNVYIFQISRSTSTSTRVLWPGPLKSILGWCMSVTKCWQLNFIEYPLIIIRPKRGRGGSSSSSSAWVAECPLLIGSRPFLATFAILVHSLVFCRFLYFTLPDVQHVFLLAAGLEFDSIMQRMVNEARITFPG